MAKSQTIALIQARGGSKGVPRKNVRPLGGYPLIAWSVAACVLSSRVDRTILSTDDEEIAEVAAAYGAEVPFMRPAEFATDTAVDKDVIRHAIDWLTENDGSAPDLIFQVRPTTPYRDPALIDAAIETMQSDDEATSLRSAFEVPESPAKMFVRRGRYFEGLCPLDGRTEYFNLPRQHFAPVFFPNGYVDIVRSQVVIDTGYCYGDRILAFEVPDVGEVDVPEDFHRLEHNLDRFGGAVYDHLRENFAPDAA